MLASASHFLNYKAKNKTEINCVKKYLSETQDFAKVLRLV
jgi:hypothetical protein